MAPILVAGGQRALDQQAVKAGAIDEQIAGDAVAIAHDERRYVPAGAIAVDMGDAPFRPFDAAQFGEFAQIGGVQAGIEMKRIGHVRD